MVLAALTHYGERLRCGVDVVGISNFVSFLERTEAYRPRPAPRGVRRRARSRTMRAFLLSIAPLTHAAEIKRPLFVAQGQNDPRVPASESEQIVRTVRKQGAPVWYVLAKRRRPRLPEEAQPRLPAARHQPVLRAVLAAAALGRSAPEPERGCLRQSLRTDLDEAILLFWRRRRWQSSAARRSRSPWQSCRSSAWRWFGVPLTTSTPSALRSGTRYRCGSDRRRRCARDRCRSAAAAPSARSGSPASACAASVS